MQVRRSFDDKFPYEVVSGGEPIFHISREFEVVDECFLPVGKRQEELVLGHPCVKRFFQAGGPTEGEVQSFARDLVALGL